MNYHSNVALEESSTHRADVVTTIVQKLVHLPCNLKNTFLENFRSFKSQFSSI